MDLARSQTRSGLSCLPEGKPESPLAAAGPIPTQVPGHRWQLTGTVTASHARSMVLLGEMDPENTELSHPLQQQLLAAGFSNTLRKGQ